MIIKNVNVATPRLKPYTVKEDFDSLEILNNVDIHIKGKRIEKIVKSNEDESSKWVIPAFCDPHTHLVFCGSRENEIDLRKSIGYDGVLSRGGGIYRTVKDTMDCDEESLFEESKQRVLSMISNGTSTFEIKTGYGMDLSSEERILSVIERIEREIGVTVKKSLLAHVLPRGLSEDRYLHDFKEMIDQFQGRIDYVDIFVDSGALTPSFARSAIIHANEIGIPARIHLNEISNVGGLEKLNDLRIVSYDHMLETRENEIGMLGSAVVTFLPFTSIILGKSSSIFGKMKEKGIILSMGSDSSPNTYILSMPLIISLVRQMTPFTLENIINMTTLNAAYSLALSSSEGSIHAGKEANLIVLRDKFSKLGYELGTDPIEEVYVKGRPFRKSLETDLRN
jgi:imidazolonepropionase